MPRPSRSLFASLPWDLKKDIRTKAQESETLVNRDTVEVKAELLRDASKDDFLPTQPASPGGIEVEDEEAAMNVDSTAAPTAEATTSIIRSPVRTPTRPIVATTSIIRSPVRTPTRPIVAAEGSSTGPASTRYRPSPSSTSQPAKKRKRKSRPAVNEHLNHPWDCTGLVERYTEAAHVPLRIRKYFHQRHALFPLYDTVPLLLDDTGWFSVTPHAIASHIAQRCQSDVIIDAFCGVGGNAIEFAKTCERVIAIDNDPVRLRLARHNALHSGVAERIEFVLADFTQWAEAWSTGRGDSEAVDVVFLSPPWGGPEYLAMENYPLTQIEPIPGDELFNLAAKITPNIAYFLPRNVNVKEIAALARALSEPEQDGTEGLQRDREWVELEEQWVGDKLKAVTAYYGGLVAE